MPIIIKTFCAEFAEFLLNFLLAKHFSSREASLELLPIIQFARSKIIVELFVKHVKYSTSSFVNEDLDTFGTNFILSNVINNHNIQTKANKFDKIIGVVYNDLEVAGISYNIFYIKVHIIVKT